MPADGAQSLEDTTAGAPSACIAATFLACLERAHHATKPYDHWLLDAALPPRTVSAVANLPFDPPEVRVFDGRRESNNSTRVYFSPAVQAQFPVAREIAEAFRDPRILTALERLTGAKMGQGHLRIEYCQDVDGFWLEPHVDIPVKLFTMLIYLSDDPALADAGTDIYDAPPQHAPAGRAEYAPNHGLIFIPGKDTWHGFTARPIRGVRKSLIVNYVTDAWRATEELA
ncbi:MAG: hypothetical protein P4L64_15965 [Caulobacteraceae bacterium]|nr:hypothetical protein [Caulobacteraceae bacterium]